MTNVSDDKWSVVRAVGTEIEYLQSLGATSNNVNHAWYELFVLGGATSPNWNVAAAQFLTAWGATSPDLPGMWAEYWAAGGGGAVASFDELIASTVPVVWYELQDASLNGSLIDSSGNDHHLSEVVGVGTGLAGPALRTTATQSLNFYSNVSRYEDTSGDIKNNYFAGATALSMTIALKVPTGEVPPSNFYIAGCGWAGDTNRALMCGFYSWLPNAVQGRAVDSTGTPQYSRAYQTTNATMIYTVTFQASGLNIYRNGLPQHSPDQAMGNALRSSVLDDFTIGYHGGYALLSDHISVHNRALTAQEITDLHTVYLSERV